MLGEPRTCASRLVIVETARLRAAPWFRQPSIIASNTCGSGCSSGTPPTSTKLAAHGQASSRPIQSTPRALASDATLSHQMRDRGECPDQVPKPDHVLPDPTQPPDQPIPLEYLLTRRNAVPRQ